MRPNFCFLKSLLPSKLDQLFSLRMSVAAISVELVSYRVHCRQRVGAHQQRREREPGYGHCFGVNPWATTVTFWLTS